MKARRPEVVAGDSIRVLVVDDSVVIRNVLSRLLEDVPWVQVVGAARNGLEAVAKVDLLRPHVVLLDVEMPELDGLDALKKIMECHHKVRVLMVSSHTTKGAQVTVEALTLGASGYVTKPPYDDASGLAFETFARQLLSKIGQLFSVEGPLTGRCKEPRALPVGLRSSRPEVFAIGVSAGGPAALSDALPMVPADFPLPIAIVQHMPPDFTRLLAERLTKLCKIRVMEGEDGMIAEPGSAVLAPGGFHMRLVRSNGNFRVKLDSGPYENSCRPAVDVLFRSLAECCKGKVLAAVMTGMGQDGLAGARMLKGLGAKVIVQDEASSVVWGMPGAVVRAKLADAILPLNQIIPNVLMRVGH